MRTSILALLCAMSLLGPLHAAETPPASASPTMQDMVTWKNGLLKKYDTLIYQAEDAKPISEDVFFSRVVTEKRGFNVENDSTAPKRLTFRLLNDNEQHAAQTHIVK